MNKLKDRSCIRNARDLTGKKFYRWTVISFHGRSERGAKFWKCMCECGKESIVNECTLPNGKSRSCGCLISESTKKRFTKHGGAKRSGFSQEYKTWRDMMRRCSDKQHKSYCNYGGRGISVCERWKNFILFAQDIPKKPNGKFSFGRINNSGIYEPENVRWESDIQQQRNTRRNRIIEYNGELLCLSEISEKYNVDYDLLRKRLDRGWSIQSAITTPKKICVS